MHAPSYTIPYPIWHVKQYYESLHVKQGKEHD
jgi:hypothetical protein